ncbi:hypothetical protein ACFL0V_00210 [Nanoarchaeota archaeon]
MKYVLCFGNPHIKEDSLALDIADYFHNHPLPDIEFIKCIAPDEVMSYIDKDFWILDIVSNITEPTLITDIDNLSNQPAISLHDFDLGFFLRMMKEMHKIENIKIIGIPSTADIKILITDIKKILTTSPGP